MWQFAEPRGLGRIVSNDAGIVVERNPDTVRDPNVAYYSYQRVPHGPLPAGCWPANPELVIENRPRTTGGKTCCKKKRRLFECPVLFADQESRKIHVFSPDRECVILHEDDVLTLPDVLPGFVGRGINFRRIGNRSWFFSRQSDEKDRSDD
jgi:hypothetical protein